MWTSALTLFLATNAPVAAQDVAPEQPRRPTAVRTLEPEFNALMLKYGAAIREYDDRRVHMARERSKLPEPPHPARLFLAEFRTLSDKGSGGAQGWILENLAAALDDSGERARIAKEVFPRLIESHSDEDSAMHAIEGLKPLSADLGENATMEMARALEQKSTNAEVRGKAMLLQAWLRSQGGNTKDPQRWMDTTEIYRSILYTVPKTSAGREVSGILIGPVEKDFFQRERKWVDALRDLQAAGKPPAEWPPQPMHELDASYQPIAAAGNHTAQRWVNKLYPSYQRVERQGPGVAGAWLVNEFGEYYSDGLDGPWNVLRLDLLTVLYRQFPTDPWIFDSLRKLLPSTELLPLERLEPAMQILLEKNREPRVRAAAMFALAQSLKARGDPKSYERAIELYTRIRDEFPDDELRQPAEGGRADLARAMPGQPAPSHPTQDAEGRAFSIADYKGRVVMLEFWSFHSTAWTEAIPLRAALLDRLAARPFSLVGVNTDSTTAIEYHDRAAKLGIKWRSALVSISDPVMDGWEVRRYPTTILIDKDGIIRARDLAWGEMVTLTEKLVAEAEPAGKRDPPK